MMKITTMIGAGVLAVVFMTGWSPFHQEVPAPAPNPGPGPTVPPKPSDPIPTPPTMPKLFSSTRAANESVSPTLTTDLATHRQEAVSGQLLQLELKKKEPLDG
ncbi:MAG: hypothetical protein GDA65_07065 [Nitrospira sp. CR1.1]|jgi:hypothetical protein|nr:hypothetical protein [Nitrospira sp. CR1.1]